MTLILKLDLDMVKIYHRTKNEVSMATASKVIALTDRHTDMMKTLPLEVTAQHVILTRFAPFWMLLSHLSKFVSC